MSRETDSSSSGAQGRGGAAYPSGTPPYGTPAQGAASEGGVDAGRQSGDARSEERKTETTLTTRIRINIPGSRPIPPVVMRTPVADADKADGGEGAGSAMETGPRAAAGVPSAETDDFAAPAEEKTSSWFAPRKPSAPQRPATDTSANGAGAPDGSRPGGATPALGTGLGAGPDAGARGLGAGPGAPGAGGSGHEPLPRRGANGLGGANSAGGANGGGSGPYDGGDAGSYDVSGAVASGPLGGGNVLNRNGGEPDRGDLPYFAQNPTGPTSGPVTGDSPLAPPLDATGGVPRMSDDTAILTPQKPAPGPGGPGAPGDNVSGHTLTSGIPVVPSTQSSPFAPGPHADGPVPHTAPQFPEPPRPSTPRPAAPKKKGRNKLVLVAVAVVALGGVAYAAGLLVNHSDVPKGTTVLGVDIGGGTRDEAVKKLDAALGDRTNRPLQLSVSGDKAVLRPDQAGLALDTEATVRSAASSDYNPVSVIGSLFGGERVVEPVMPVDEEKLHSALERAAGASGSANDGTIKFVPGKAIAVYGKAGKGIDVDKSASAVEEAYRAQVETDRTTPVQVPTTTRRPTVSNAEVDRMMKAFAQPAMSGLVTIKAGNKSIPFGPAKSLPQILGVKAVNGKLVDTYDMAALKKLYGNTFDGVLITRATGKKTPVQPSDVVGVLRQALLGKTPAQRIGVIETNPS